jgi:outer membrane protein TolC
MRFQTFIILLIFCLLQILVSAQETLTLRQCIATGLKNNYALRMIRNEEQIARNNATAGNAGLFPTLSLEGSYGGTWSNYVQQIPMNNENAMLYYNAFSQNLNVGLFLNYTIFDGFAIQSNYKILKELQTIGELQTRLSIENYIAELTSEYYDWITQFIQYTNLNYAIELSYERLRIVQERYNLGSASKLDVQQARVDYNADMSRYIKQKELYLAAAIRLNRLMGVSNVEHYPFVKDTLLDQMIPIRDGHPFFISKEKIWQSCLQNNVYLIIAERYIELGKWDIKSVKAANYPYLKFQAGYAYTHDRYALGNYKKDNTLGMSFGLTLGYKLFDGMNRVRQQKNAKISLENKQLAKEDIRLSLQSDFVDIWMAWQNNLELLVLEEENTKTAENNYQIAIERYKLGDLSGFELREAQNGLIEAKERYVQAQYNTKLCEISLFQISGRMEEVLND